MSIFPTNLTTALTDYVRGSSVIKSFLPVRLLNKLNPVLEAATESVQIPHYPPAYIAKKTIKSLDTIDTVIYHGSCMDGAGAQLAAFLRLRDKRVKYIPGYYHRPPPSLQDKTVIFVDFVYPASHMVKIIEECKAICVIDHHVTNETQLRQFPDAWKIFDSARSAAGLAWEYFHPKVPMPKLLSYIEDRDIWKYKLPNSMDIGAAIHQYRPNLDSLYKLYEEGDAAIQRLAQEGAIIQKSTQKLVDTAVNVSQRLTYNFKGKNYNVYVCNTGVLRSEIGNALCNKKDCAAAFIYAYDMQRHCNIISVRSAKTYIDETGREQPHDEWIDASLLAEEYGGGGHQHASSFTYYGHIEDLFRPPMILNKANKR